MTRGQSIKEVLTNLGVLYDEPSPELLHPDYGFCEVALGGIENRNNVVFIPDLDLSNFRGEGYASIYRYTINLKQHVERTGSVSGLPDQPIWADMMFFDIDSLDLNKALDDCRTIVDRIERIDPELLGWIKIYFSGSKGFHIGLPSKLAGLSPSANLPQEHLLLATVIAGPVEFDQSIFRKVQLFRLANTVNRKSGLFKTELTIKQLRTYSVDEIKVLAKTPQGTPHLHLLSKQDDPKPNPNLIHALDEVRRTKQHSDDSSTSEILKKDIGWVGAALDNLKKGNRHTTMTSITGWLVGRKSPDSICEFLLPHAKRCGFPEEELRSLVSDVYKRYHLESSQSYHEHIDEQMSTELESISLPYLLATTDPEIHWLVSNLIPENSMSILAGAAGAGKSMLAMDLSLALSLGKPFLDYFETRQATVLYIDEENGRQTLAMRFSKLLKGHEIQDVPENLHLCVFGRVILDDPERFAALCRLVEKTNPDVIIFDTFKRVTRGEENSATEISKVVSVIRGLIVKYSVSVILLDHHRKTGRTGNTPDQLLRGSSDKAAAVDCGIALRKTGENIEFIHFKSRVSKPVDSLILSIQDQKSGGIKIDVCGLAKDIVGRDRTLQVLDFVIDEIGDGELSRQKILAAGKEQGLSGSMIDEALKLGVEENQLIRENRKPKGRGGNLHFYRLAGSLEQKQEESGIEEDDSWPEHEEPEGDFAADWSNDASLY